MLLRSTRDGESGGCFICSDGVDNDCFFEKITVPDPRSDASPVSDRRALLRIRDLPK